MQIHNAAVTGSFTYNGIDISDITGSEQSVTSLNDFSASILNYTSSNNQSIASLNAASASLFAATASLFNYTSSNTMNIANLFATSASLNASVAQIQNATASIYGATSSLFTYTSSNNANIAALYTVTASIYNATASIYGATSSLFNFSSSATLRINALDQYTASLNTRSASFACTTATNNFACTQYFSNTSNAVSFTSTGSLYSDGGVRITRDMYVSGTAFFNNVTVFGTQSINYISSSQLNIASNIISVNTATPTVRFGGLAVYDSGSLGTGLTGSLLWDSEDNQWIYSNPSGSTYDSALFLVGPRNTGVLGNEPGISCNFLSKGNGMHHMTSSGIFEDGSRTCFYGNTVIGSGGTVCTTMANTSCIGINTQTPFKRLTINASGVASDGVAVSGDSSPAYIICETSGVGSTFTNDSAAGYIGTITNHPFNVRSNNQNRLTFSSAGVACFACQVCAPVSIITGCASIGSLSAPTSTVDITRSSPDPFNTVQCQLSLVNTAGNGGAGAQLNFNIGSAVPYIRGLVDGANSLVGAALTFGTACYNGPGVERLRISSTGIACFACTICAPTIMAAGAISATGVICSTNTIQSNTQVYVIGCPPANNGGLMNVRDCFANNSNVTFAGTFYNSSPGNDFSIGKLTCNTNGFLQIRNGNNGCGFLVFDGSGISTFNCQVCVPQLSISAGTDLMATFNSTTNNPYIRFGHSSAYQFFIGESSVVGGAGFCGYDIYANCGIRFYTGAQKRIQISNTGETCFAGTTCIPTLMLGASVAANFRINISGHYAAETASWPTDGSGDCYRSGIGWQSTANASQVLSSFITTINDGNYGGHIVFLNRGTNGGNLNERFRITSGGIACFASTVCGGTGVFGNTGAGSFSLVISNNDQSNARIRLTNTGTGGQTFSLIAGTNGVSNSGFAIFDETNSATRLQISNAGVACFASTVCAPGIIVGSSQDNTILSSSRIHLNTCVQRFYTINHWSLANGSFSCTVTDSAATYGCAKAMPLNGSSTFFFGPYSYLTPGSYVAKFRMKVDNNSSTSRLFGLDTNRGGGVQVAPSTFCTSGCYQYINLPFTISSPSDVFEARALDYASGITCAYLDHVLIEAAENPGQYFSKDRFNLYTGNFNCPRLIINTDGSTIFNCNGTYCSNYGYNFLCTNNGSILSGTHTMGNVGAGTTCATPLWCLNGGVGGALRMEFNWSTNDRIQWINHNNCTPYLLQWSTDYNTKHCFDYVGNACHCGIVIARGYQGASFSTLSAGSGTGTASFDTITRSGVGLYEVAIVANPNAGGSDYYDFWYGHIIVGRGYSGAAVTDYITWCQESPPPRCLYPSGGGGLVVTACMFQSGVESTCIGRDGSYTIRFKIAGYNSSYTGANTTIYLKSII